MSDTYPILEFDPSPVALIEPRRLLTPIDIPERCVVCFFQDVINDLSRKGQISEIAHLKSEMGSHPVYRITGVEPAMALLHPGVGAPLAAGLLEEAIALGCQKFIACGGAGTLDSSHEVGKLIVPIAAIRDEGTSYHYLPPGREVAPTNLALEAIKTTLANSGVPYELTKTWTTDAIYRETKTKINLRREDGCACVEMEAAALFAVARFRNVELAQILYAGDDLSGEFWDSRNWDDRKEIREELLKVAVRACCML